MAYKPQYGPGQTQIAENRRKQMDPTHKLEKLRDVSDKDVVLVMGHRAPGVHTRRSQSSRNPRAPSASS